MAEPGGRRIQRRITVPATDGYPLCRDAVSAPRGQAHHAVLINSATAVPRKLYRGFAGYLARRGCAVLTYDYRGTGDSRQQALTGYNQPKSLVGFKASMSDWAAQDIAAAVAWMRERYKACPLPMSAFVRRPGARPPAEQIGDFARVVHRSPSGLLEADGLAGTLPRLRPAEFCRRSLNPRARLHAGQGRPRHGPAEGRVPAMGRLGDEPALSVQTIQSSGLQNFRNTRARCARSACPTIPGRRGPRSNCCARDLPRSSLNRHGDAADTGASQIGHIGIFPARASRHAWRGAAEWIEAEE